MSELPRSERERDLVRELVELVGGRPPRRITGAHEPAPPARPDLKDEQARPDRPRAPSGR